MNEITACYEAEPLVIIKDVAAATGKSLLDIVGTQRCAVTIQIHTKYRSYRTQISSRRITRRRALRSDEIPSQDQSWQYKE